MTPALPQMPERRWPITRYAWRLARRCAELTIENRHLTESYSEAIRQRDEAADLAESWKDRAGIAAGVAEDLRNQLDSWMDRRLGAGAEGAEGCCSRCGRVRPQLVRGSGPMVCGLCLKDKP